MGDFSILAIRLKCLRTSLDLTQKDFAKFIGCTAATLSAYENGSKSPSLEIIKTIAEKCNISIDWLCGLSEKKRLTNKIETYRDLYEHLFLLDENDAAHMEFHLFKCEPDNVFEHYQSIHFINYDIGKFLEEWEKMRELHLKGSIDDELYELWKEKTLNKSNIKLTDELPFN